MSDIQFDRGYVNAQEAATGRFGGGGSSAPVEGEFGFDDFLDIINPLQHIPVVSTLYREITGDEISAPARMFGGTLFGGAGGFVSAMVNTVLDEVAGADLGSSVMALFKDEDAADPQVAQPAGTALTAEQAQALTAVPLITASGRPLTSAGVSSDAAAAAIQPQAPVPQATRTEAQGPENGDSPAQLPAAAPQQRSDGGLLTGQAALNALFNDLRGSAATPGQPPPQGNETPAAPLRPAAASSRREEPGPIDRQQTMAPSGDAANSPLILAAQAPDAALADRMLMALDKYRAMSQRHQDGEPERADAVGGSRLPATDAPPKQ